MKKTKGVSGETLPWDEVHRLVKMVSDLGLGELSVRSPELEVRIVGRVAAQAPAPPGSAPQLVVEATPREQSFDQDLAVVTSPMVGTFFRAAKPGADPFVDVGKAVEPGDVLCIVEAMKLMNEIEADRAGVIERVFATDGQPVEYGQRLFGIRPA
ncbi:MAG: acetyl-CoA carboxylase biotin carboxyl carrier protein [Acidobacteriota bacterium]